MGFFQEFKTFAMKGNVVDLAVGVVIGTAFGKVVSSLVSDIIMPVIGLLTNGIDFSTLKWIIKPAHDKEAEVAIMYGNFINSIVNLIIIALAIFFVIKAMNKLRNLATEVLTEEELLAQENQEAKLKEEKEVVVELTAEQKLLGEIRDLLKEQVQTKLENSLTTTSANTNPDKTIQVDTTPSLITTK